MNTMLELARDMHDSRLETAEANYRVQAALQQAEAARHGADRAAMSAATSTVVQLRQAVRLALRSLRQRMAPLQA